MEKKYQIFISSTYEDLKEERKKVQDTILSMYQFPIGMEMFSAADEEQWEIIQETIDSSDYYVLIIGHRYGSVIGEGEYAGISYTQKEFRYALEKKIPILAFLISDIATITPDKMESDSDKKRKLQEFISEVKKGRTVQWWNNCDDLAYKVMNSLNKQINRGKRPGWVRADKFDINSTQNELVEMSRKIRKLEEENEEYKSQLSARKPVLKMEINNSDVLQVTYKEYNTNIIDCEYMELTMDDIPPELKSFISQASINEYNDTLPSSEVLDKFKEDWRFYKQAKEDPFYLDLKVCNDGNMKAKDIYVEIEFPNEIEVYKSSSDITEPVMPHKGKNPIDEYYKKRNSYKALFPTTAYKENNKFNYSDLLGAELMANSNSPNQYYYNSVHSISIRMEDLMTDYTWNTGEKFFIVPKQRGEFEIVCSYVCEEYEKSIEQIIKVVVK